MLQLATFRRERHKSDFSDPNMKILWMLLIATLAQGAGVARAELPVEISAAVRGALGELAVSAERTIGALGGRVVILQLGPGDASSRIRNELPAFVAAELRTSRRVESETADGLSMRLQKIYMDSQDMQDRAKRVAFYGTQQAAGLDWFILLTDDSLADQLRIQVRLEHVGSGGTTIEVSREVPKSDLVLAYLGEPIPKTLYVSAPVGAVISVNDRALGVAGSEPVGVRLLAGSHNVKVRLDGYAEYSAPVSMPGDRNMQMAIKRRSNSGAPLSSMLCGAVLPGWSVAKYGNAVSGDGSFKHSSSTATFIGAAVFYVGLGIWGVDRVFAKDGLTRDSLERRDKIESTELAISLGGYAINLVGSFIIGQNFARDNRTLTLDEFSGATTTADAGITNGKIGLAFVAGPSGVMPMLGYSGRF